MKQEIWLKEIRRKQQLGGIAFVKGDLLVRRLPDELEEYLEIDFSEGLQGYIQSPKSRLNKIMQELYG